MIYSFSLSGRADGFHRWICTFDFDAVIRPTNFRFQFADEILLDPYCSILIVELTLHGAGERRKYQKFSHHITSAIILVDQQTGELTQMCSQDMMVMIGITCDYDFTVIAGDSLSVGMWYGLYWPIYVVLVTHWKHNKHPHSQSYSSFIMWTRLDSCSLALHDLSSSLICTWSSINVQLWQ